MNNLWSLNRLGSHCELEWDRDSLAGWPSLSPFYLFFIYFTYLFIFTEPFLNLYCLLHSGWDKIRVGSSP